MAVRRRGKSRRNRWHDGHELQVLDGVDWFGDAWGNDPWNGLIERRPCTRPWAWWRWDAPEPRSEALPEPEQLDRLGLLSEEEQDALREAELVGNEPFRRYFRRPWIWWHDRGDRDWSKPEAIQLVELDVLTEFERKVLADPSPTMAKIVSYQTALTDEEKTFLKLPKDHHRHGR